jgi:membrane protein involved in colicin uptake
MYLTQAKTEAEAKQKQAEEAAKQKAAAEAKVTTNIYIHTCILLPVV